MLLKKLALGAEPLTNTMFNSPNRALPLHSVGFILPRPPDCVNRSRRDKEIRRFAIEWLTLRRVKKIRVYDLREILLQV